MFNFRRNWNFKCQPFFSGNQKKTLKRNQFLVFTRCHGGHVGDPKQRDCSQFGSQTNQSLGNWVLFTCKLSLLFWSKNKAADITWLKTSLQSLQEILDFWNDIPFPLGVCPSHLSSLFVCLLLPVVANEQIKIIVNREQKNLNDKGKVLSQACIFCQENLQ